MSEQEEIDALERSLQSLFDGTISTPETEQLTRMARQSAQIPKPFESELAGWTRQWLAPGIMALGVAVVCLMMAQPSLPQHATPIPINFPQENEFGLGIENDLSSDVIDPGFGLLHGSEALDADILEDSFQALLEARRKT